MRGSRIAERGASERGASLAAAVHFNPETYADYAVHDIRYVQRGDSDSDGDGERRAAGEWLRRQRQQGEQRGEQRLNTDGSGDYIINRADDNANQSGGPGDGTMRSVAERAVAGEGPGGLGDRTGVGR